MKTLTMHIAAIAALFFSVNCLAQNPEGYSPSDKWPYIYESFQQGTTYANVGSARVEGRFNVCVDDGTLHYLSDKDIILQADMSNIGSLVVGNTSYVNVNGKLFEVKASSDAGYIVVARKVSLAQGAEIGFGIVSEGFAANSLDLSTILSALGLKYVNTYVGDVMEERPYGQRLNIDTELWVKSNNGHFFKADKGEFQNIAGKDESKAFLKDHKVKWNDPVSLLQVLEYCNNK